MQDGAQLTSLDLGEHQAMLSPFSHHPRAVLAPLLGFQVLVGGLGCRRRGKLTGVGAVTCAWGA